MHFDNKKINTRGFTLPEMMVVVGIIAILSMIAIPVYTGYLEKGRLTMAQAELMDLNNVIRLDRVENPGKSGIHAEYSGSKLAKKFRVHPKVAEYYDISVAPPAYYLLAVPNAKSGYSKAVWMKSTGEVYRCDSADSARNFETSGKCERVGGAE
ncbi:type IV pilin protein [Neisseria weaveri]|uniref:type IV pilin protein n=1 Tax=Neisseria weaveri TaxID=28091 RepID=UPI000D31AB2B|nr:PilX family type IV pilin [Neisseria weaveri]